MSIIEKSKYCVETLMSVFRKTEVLYRKIPLAV